MSFEVTLSDALFGFHPMLTGPLATAWRQTSRGPGTELYVRQPLLKSQLSTAWGKR